ncbi:MAG: hypothetical protein H6839_11515 [Planctomycetes bacterium]|nr:hypothetical protein [Planctomycetota bacterium]
MKKTIIAAAACVALLAGCSAEKDEKIASLQGQVKSLEANVQHTNARNETLQDQVTELDGKLHDAETEADELRLKLQKASKDDNSEEVARLNKRIGELQSEIDRLKAAPVASEPEKDSTDPAEPTKTPVDPQPDPELQRKLEDLLPLVKGETGSESLRKLQTLLYSADKATRDDYIAKVRKWVEDEPQNKQARMALASVLTTRFQDLKNPMDQGALATQIKKETETALEIDPEYYEAQHFLAILKVNYPTFMPEFTGADKDLDKALELQAKMTWEDRFADIYSAYGMWYRKQEKYDEAAAKVQAGLDHAPRNQGLLDEQQAIEDARKAAEQEG